MSDIIPPSIQQALTNCTLLPGQKLLPGQSLHAANGTSFLAMQGDGNLVLYRQQNHNAPWASGTCGQPAQEVIMQDDGNLVIYRPDGKPIWASNTAGKPGAYLIVQDDGNVVIYLQSQPIWATNTCM